MVVIWLGLFGTLLNWLGLWAELGLATVGSFGLAFANGIWMPVVSPVIGLIGTALATSAWRAYQTNQEQQQMLQLTRNQEQTIEALKQLLSQQPPRF